MDKNFYLIYNKNLDNLINKMTSLSKTSVNNYYPTIINIIFNKRIFTYKHKF